MKASRLFFILPLFLSSCFSLPFALKPGDPDWGVEVTWYGHSCFSLRDSSGRTVVIDPYDETVGYDSLRLKADALLITHAHFDHDNKRAVRPRSRSLDIIESTGTISVAEGLVVTGIASEHDAYDGQVHGPNRMYSFFMGGLLFVHMGDIGQPELRQEQIDAMGPVDVLMIPVGGVTTIDAVQARRMVSQLRPRVVLPMHTNRLRSFHLAPAIEFEKQFSSGEVMTSKEGNIRLRRAELTETTIVYSLTPASSLDH